MSAQTTTDQLGVKPWQAREEAVEGTMENATDGIGAVAYVDKYGVLPPVLKSSIKVNNSYREVSQVGPEDVFAIKRGKKVVEFSTTLGVTNSQKAFLKYLANAANYASPFGTPAKSLSIFFSQYVDNGSGTLTEYFYKFAGCRAKTSTWSLKEDGDWEIAVDWIAKDLTIATTGVGGTATVQTAYPSEEIWDFDDGGANHATWNAAAIQLKEFSVTFDRKTAGDWATGNRLYYGSKTHGRRMAGTFKALLLGVGTGKPYDDFEGATPDTARTLAIVMKTGQYTLTFTGTKLKDLGEDADGESTEGKAHLWGFSCTGFTNLA